MDSTKPYATSMSPSTKIDKDDSARSADTKRDKGMIGSLLRLAANRLISSLQYVYVPNINLVEKCLT